MSNNSPDQLELAASKYEGRGVWGARAIIGGLLFEVGIALAVTFGFDNKYVEHWSTVGATLLIAGGVYWEVHFGRRSSEAYKQLRALADERLAEANENAAKAHERAAILEKEAAEARERTAEIERLTMPRRISWQQKDDIVKAIRRKLPDRILILYHLFDIEASMYSLELYGVFVEADAKFIDRQGIADLNDSNIPFGLFISSRPDVYASLALEAFRDADIPANKGAPPAREHF
jgi:hypothetical protein